MLPVNCLSLDPRLLLLVAQRLQFPSLGVLMFLARYMKITWAVGTQRDWLRLLERCLQTVASLVFGYLDPFLLTEIIINCLKGTEHRDLMMSRSSLRRAIIKNELKMPSLV